MFTYRPALNSHNMAEMLPNLALTQKPHKKLQKTTIQTLVVLGKQDTGLLNVREYRKSIQE
jgi:hypothetical protein